jgi:hypothetical protein
MSTIIDFPNTPSENDIFFAAGKAWQYSGGSWKRYTLIISDGGYADTVYAMTDDGGNANGL